MLSIEILEETICSFWKSIRHKHHKKPNIKGKPDNLKGVKR